MDSQYYNSSYPGQNAWQQGHLGQGYSNITPSVTANLQTEGTLHYGPEHQQQQQRGWGASRHLQYPSTRVTLTSPDAAVRTPTNVMVTSDAQQMLQQQQYSSLSSMRDNQVLCSLLKVHFNVKINYD